MSYPTIEESLCIGCANCVVACPHSVFRMEEDLAVIDVVDWTKCEECRLCVKSCPMDAITVHALASASPGR